MTSLLLDTPLSAEQREFAETIRSSGDALLTVINDILDFSKIEARRIDLERQPFDLRECVESALGLVAGQASAKGIEVGCWIDPQCRPASWAMRRAFARSCSTSSAMPASSPRRVRS